MIPPALRILVCTEAIDMRLGFDRLAAAVREKLGADPVTGGLYIFANRGATRLKLLWFDRGFCLLYKRLHGAVFGLPLARDGACAVRIDRAAVATLLAGVERPRRRRPGRGHPASIAEPTESFTLERSADPAGAPLTRQSHPRVLVLSELCPLTTRSAPWPCAKMAHFRASPTAAT